MYYHCQYYRMQTTYFCHFLLRFHSKFKNILGQIRIVGYDVAL